MRSPSAAKGFSQPALSQRLRTPGLDRAMEAMRPRLAGWLASRGLPPDDVEDLVQEAMLRLLRWPPPEDLIEQSAFRAAEGALIDFWRRRPKGQVPMDEQAESAAVVPDPSGAWSLEADLSQALLAMPKLHREVLMLAAAGHTEAESAAILGASPQRVGRALRRVRVRLARLRRAAPG